MLEKNLKRRVIERLEKKNACWHVVTTGVALVGCPDIIGCYQGRFFALELKAGTNLSETQKKMADDILDAVGMAWVVYRIDDVDKMFKAIDYILERKI